jgi:NitT/TauT family transport system substrate-binding protein
VQPDSTFASYSSKELTMSDFFATHRLTRRQALWFATGAIASASLPACAKPSTPAANTLSTLSMGITTWIGNAPIYIALEKGFFKDLGLDLKLEVFQTVAAGFPAFLAGKLAGLSPVSSEAVALAAQGSDFKIVAVEDTSVGADVIMARNRIATIKDFKGKKIGTELGGIGHFFILQILAEAGLTEKDVTLINTPPDVAAAAYQKGDLEIAYSYSPFSDQALKAQKDGRVIYSSKQMPTAIADLYIFSTAFIQANPKVVAAFVEGHFKGLELLKTNPKEGLAIMAKQLKITPDELAEQLKGIQMPDVATNVTMLGDPNSEVSLLKPLTNLATFLKSQGKITIAPDMAKYLDPQFVKALPKA